MKNIKKNLFFVNATVNGFSQTNSNSKEAIYTCEMHPETRKKSGLNAEWIWF
jgi:hypothetical protein